MDAVIPAAGRGTRMGSLTADRPKPMVEVAGEPIIERALGQLAEACIDRFVVVVGSERAAIEDHLGPAFRGRPITYVDQPEPLGLGDAIRRAEPHVDGPFVSFHGDNVVVGDLGPVADGAEPTGDGTTTPVAVVPVRDVDPATAQASTVCAFDRRGSVVGIEKRPDEPPSTKALCGLYRFEPAVFDALREVSPDDDGEYRLVDALNELLAAGHRVETVALPGDRVNVNTPADVARAERLVRRAETLHGDDGGAGSVGDSAREADDSDPESEGGAQESEDGAGDMEGDAGDVPESGPS